MQSSDKGFRERQKKLIRQRTRMITDYRAKHLDEKTKERFRRPVYSVPGRENEEVNDDETNDHT